jgi:hypothetical protein
MDTAMVVLTAGVPGVAFALGKTLAALGLVLFGGLVTEGLSRGTGLVDPPRPGIGSGGCAGAKVRAPSPVIWWFWNDPARRVLFGRAVFGTTLPQVWVAA